LLQDPNVLGKAIPGCESLTRTGDNEYELKLKMLLASLSGDFVGKVTLADHEAPTRFRMIVEGSGKIGFLKGEGVLTLIAISSGTEVAYDGDAQIGGKMASVGQRLIDTTAKLLVKRFFKKLVKQGFGQDPDIEDEDEDV
jgi:carbon monoxide dehydrogenase subunit G